MAKVLGFLFLFLFGALFADGNGKEISLSGRSSPRIDLLDAEVRVRINNTARIPCIVHGGPRPFVYWIKDGKQLVIDDVRIQFIQDYLEIQDVLPSDAGLFTCVADSGYGTPAEKHTRLIVEEIFQLAEDPEPCRGQFYQWSFNPQMDQCEEFVFGYSGNQFHSLHDCEARCKKRTVESSSKRTGVNADPCTLPLNPGPCKLTMFRWYFDRQERLCKPFAIGGCGGNKNRFVSEESCIRACGEFKGHDDCSLQYDRGRCLEKFPRWYYNLADKECKRFVYGGCGGNGNRFESKKECHQVCIARNFFTKSSNTELESTIATTTTVEYDTIKPTKTTVHDTTIQNGTTTGAMTPFSDCSDFTFGCCPDGVSAAKGPNYEGCPDPFETCETSKHGCCLDGWTPAEGENFVGCDYDESDSTCRDSLFGCCPDGSTTAKGPAFDGCGI